MVHNLKLVINTTETRVYKIVHHDRNVDTLHARYVNDVVYKECTDQTRVSTKVYRTDTRYYKHVHFTCTNSETAFVKVSSSTRVYSDETPSDSRLYTMWYTRVYTIVYKL